MNLPGGILVHSGGWKKLQEAAVDPDTFRRRVHAVTGVGRVINFYGMVEQVGGVYFENPIHHLHAPIFSEVIIRDPLTLDAAAGRTARSGPGAELPADQLPRVTRCSPRTWA